jgi:signal transduction histidine kinase
VIPTQLQIVLIAAGWSAGVGVAGLMVAWSQRHRSLRVLTAWIAVVAVAAVLAGVLGTARAMFLSTHDLHVVVVVALVAGAVGVAYALAVGAALASRSRSLREATRRLGESGPFVAPSSGPAELRELATELDRTNRRLAEARERESRLEDSRRELVSWVSHDLRTPLAGLRAMAEALEDGMVDDPGRYHRQMRHEVDRMVRMVDDLFTLSRIHAGSLRLEVQPVGLTDLVSEALASADPVAQARGVRLTGSVQPGLELTADPAELSRVMSNLLMNAIRHTPAEGAVRIDGRAIAHGVEVSVLDGCGGLAGDEMARVFDVGWQGSAARSPDEAPGPAGRGAGLGLAIVRGIVEAHRGRVTLANESGGCRFSLVFPA